MNSKKVLRCLKCNLVLEGKHRATNNPDGSVDHYKVCPKCGSKVFL